MGRAGEARVRVYEGEAGEGGEGALVLLQPTQWQAHLSVAHNFWKVFKSLPRAVRQVRDPSGGTCFPNTASTIPPAMVPRVSPSATVSSCESLFTSSKPQVSAPRGPRKQRSPTDRVS
jgi:hypothetical protein